jgi:hypothetical protein
VERPESRVIGGKKFMWDGKKYDSIDQATKVRAEYEESGFEARVVEEDDAVRVYSRRVVAEVEVDKSATT